MAARKCSPNIYVIGPDARMWRWKFWDLCESCECGPLCAPSTPLSSRTRGPKIRDLNAALKSQLFRFLLLFNPVEALAIASRLLRGRCAPDLRPLAVPLYQAQPGPNSALLR